MRTPSGGSSSVARFPFPRSSARAGSPTEASAVVTLDHRPFQFVVVPGPGPAAHRLGLHRLHHRRGRARGRSARDRTRAVPLGPQPRRPPLLISTLPQEKQVGLLERIRDKTVQPGDHARSAPRPTRPCCSRSRPPTARPSTSLLQRSLEEAQGPLRRLELQIFALSSVGPAPGHRGRDLLRPRRHEPAAAAGRGRATDRQRRLLDPGRDRPRTTRWASSRPPSTGWAREISGREEQIRFQGSHDGLTGLPNRTLFLDHLGFVDRECEAARHPGRAWS